MAKDDLDLGLVFYPVVFAGLGASVLFLLQQFFKGVAVAASKTFAAQGPLQKQLQPVVAQYVKPILENLFGSLASGFTVRLEHVLLSAILIVLIGIWHTLDVGNNINRMRRSRTPGAPAAKGDKEQ